MSAAGLARAAVALPPHDIAPARAADFDRLLTLTRTLRQHLEAGSWGEAAVAEAERRAVLERVFDATPTAAELPVLTSTLREVVRLNDELIGLADHHRRAAEREIDTVGRGRAALLAYGASGAGGRP